MQLGIERRMVPHIPWGLIASILAVSLLGIWNLASASRPPHNPVWTHQMVNLLVALAAAGAVCLVDYRFIRRMAVPVYLLNLAALIALKVIGHRAKGAESWFALVAGGLVAAVIWNDYVRDAPEPRRTFVRQLLKHHQSQRIASWLDPAADLRGSSYHAAQSKIAVGSGGLAGKGWGHGTQTGLFFLPEQHTDFIFSVWAEEHGFLMCLLLLSLYAAILLLAVGVAFNSRDRFGAFVAVGVAAMIFWQVFENIGMVSGLLPVTGITLPLMSYGGSSLVSVLIGLGLLVNISMRRHIF